MSVIVTQWTKNADKWESRVVPHHRKEWRLTCLGGPTLFAAAVETCGTAFFAACGFCFALCAACILNSCVRCHFSSFIFSSGICQMMGCRCAFSCFFSLCSNSCLPLGEEMYCSISFCFSSAERGVEERNCSGSAEWAY